MTPLPLAATVAAQLATSGCTGYAVAAADHAPGIAYVTGPGLTQATAVLAADPTLLLTRCYSGGELALVVTVFHPDTHPPVAPPARPAGWVPTDPTERDLWGALQSTAAWDGTERRTRERTALDAWLTWALRETPIHWTGEAPPPPLTDRYRAECRAALRGEDARYVTADREDDCGAAGPGAGAADAASAGDPADAPLSALDGREVRRCRTCGCPVDTRGRGQHQHTPSIRPDAGSPSTPGGLI